MTIFGIWRDGHRFIGATPDKARAVTLMRDCGLSEREIEQLLALARPEGWATVSVSDTERVTLVLTET